MASESVRRVGADGAGGRLRRGSRREGRRRQEGGDARGHGGRQARHLEGRRRHADGLGPEGPRRPERARSRSSTSSSRRSTRTSRSSASRSPSRTCSRRSSSRSRARTRRTSSQANQGRGDHGRDGQGRAAPPGHRLREGLRLGRPLLADAAGRSTRSRPTARSSAPATCTGSRRRARSWASSTTRTRSRRRRRRSTSSRPRCRRPRTRARRRSCSATSRSGRASTTSRRVLGQTADKQAIRDFVFAKEGASFDNPEFTAGADEDQGLGRQGLLQQELQRHRLRPGVAVVREGQEPLPDRGHVGRRPTWPSRWATRSASC